MSFSKPLCMNVTSTKKYLAGVCRIFLSYDTILNMVDYICYGSHMSTFIDEYKPVSNTVHFKAFINQSFRKRHLGICHIYLTTLVVPTVRGWEKIFMVTYFGGLVDTRITNYFQSLHTTILNMEIIYHYSSNKASIVG